MTPVPLTDLRLLEIIVSKQCHDLISPISAINNGIELISDLGEDARPEADILIADSARNAAKRLKLFRYAYGVAGNDVSIKDIKDTAESYFAETKFKLQWPAELPPHAGLGKVLLNILLLAPDILGASGEITFEVMGTALNIIFTGANAKLPEDLAAALDQTILLDNPEPRVAQALLTAQFAARARLVLLIPEQRAGSIILHLNKMA